MGKKISEALGHNKGKLISLLGAGLNFALDPLTNGRFNAWDFIAASLGFGLGVYYDYNSWNTDTIDGLKYQLSKSDSNKAEDRITITKDRRLNFDFEGRDQSTRKLLQLDAKKNMNFAIAGYLQDKPDVKNILDNLCNRIDDGEQRVARIYSHPITKYTVEFEVFKGVEEAYRLIVKEKPEEELRKKLNSISGPLIAEYVQSDGYSRKARKEKAGILFGDLINFTGWSEDQNPEDVFNILNEDYNRLQSILTEKGVVIDKKPGDCIMAFSGPPLNKTSLAYRIIDSAFEIIDAHNKYQEELKAEGKVLPDMSIGISYGTPAVGFLGQPTDELFLSDSPGKSEYTVMGKSVNLASRLCSNANANCILISEGLMEKYKDEVEKEGASPKYLDKFSKIDPVECKGFSEKVPALEYRKKES